MGLVLLCDGDEIGGSVYLPYQFLLLTFGRKSRGYMYTPIGSHDEDVRVYSEVFSVSAPDV